MRESGSNRIPAYRCIDEKSEKSQSVSKRLDAGFETLSEDLQESVADSVPENLFFVDTSDVFLNPLRSSSTISVFDNEDRKTKQSSLWDIFKSYGIELPYKFLIARLYIKREASAKQNSLLKRRFRELFEEKSDARYTHA